MEAEGPAARRLPQQVVLREPRAGPAGELRAGRADLGGENGRGDGAVRLPAVADLAGQVGGVAALAPVPLVRLEPGLELAAKERLEALAQALSRRGLNDARHDDEAVLGERLALLFGQHKSGHAPPHDRHGRHCAIIGRPQCGTTYGPRFANPSGGWDKGAP